MMKIVIKTASWKIILFFIYFACILLGIQSVDQ